MALLLAGLGAVAVLANLRAFFHGIWIFDNHSKEWVIAVAAVQLPVRELAQVSDFR